VKHFVNGEIVDDIVVAARTRVNAKMAFDLELAFL
jgi:hypothetical protein